MGNGEEFRGKTGKSVNRLKNGPQSRIHTSGSAGGQLTMGWWSEGRQPEQTHPPPVPAPSPVSPLESAS